MTTLAAADVKDLGTTLETAISPVILSTLAAWKSTGPVTTPPAQPLPHADSPDGTDIVAGGTIWFAGLGYTIDPTGRININGVPDMTTSDVVHLKLVKGAFEQTNIKDGVWSFPLKGGIGIWLRDVVQPVSHPLPAPPIVVSTGSETFSVRDWSTLKISSQGEGGMWANSIPPGQNRTLNPSAEYEYYLDSTNLPSGVKSPFTINDQKQMVITAYPHDNGYNLMYASGCLTSQKVFNQKYGLFKMNMALPMADGFWPAGWLLPSSLNYTGEIDVMERFGRTNTIQATLHGTVNGTWQSPNSQLDVKPDIGGMHEYAVDWREDFTTFLTDGVATGKFTTPDGLKEPCYLLYDLAVFHANTWGPMPSDGTSASMTLGDLIVMP